MALKVAALCCVVLSLGQSIWASVHHIPLFSSQHLPARILFLAILLLALVLAAGAERAWRFARVALGPRPPRWRSSVSTGSTSL